MLCCRSVPRIALYVAVLSATFVLGVALHLSLKASSNNLDLPPVATVRSDELHCLYEAAGLSGDAELRKEVFERIVCMGDDGSLNARQIQFDGGSYCLADGTEDASLRLRPAGGRQNVILLKHSEWCKKNLDFIAGISTAAKARTYVREHLPR